MTRLSAEVPKTRLSFVNVELVPVRTRTGQTRYLCATWGGAMHLFGPDGREAVIPYPEDTAGSYAFVADREDGYAWAVHTGGKLTRIDVDRGAVDFVQDIPLPGLNWSAGLTGDGFLVCAAHPGHILVYNTSARRVAHRFAPFPSDNTKGKCVRLAPDGWVVIAMLNPGAELVRLNPRTGEHHTPRRLDDTLYTFPHAFTFLADGRMALPRARQIETLTYPDARESTPLAYPEPGDDWHSFRDPGDGCICAWNRDGGPLYRLDEQGEWQTFLNRFSPVHRHRELTLFARAPDAGLMSLTQFGEVLKMDPDGRRECTAQLRNLGHQRVSALEPGAGNQVFTSTFINSSFQEMDLTTGTGRNITPCQAHSGQVTQLLWFRDRLWLAGYGGAEINIYTPGAGGEWPDNPRPGVRIGAEQMRPLALKTDGKALWCVTNARYGLLNGALARIDPDTLTRKVWRGLVPDSNPTSLVLHRGTAFVGTTIQRDQGGGAPGPRPGAVVAFDTAREHTAWTARPDARATAIKLVGILPPDDGDATPATADETLLAIVFTDTGRRLLSLRLEDGAVLQSAPPQIDNEAGAWRLFVSRGRLCLARADGIFRYHLDDGVGECLIPGPVSPDPEPVTRGHDLFYSRGNSVVKAEVPW